LAERRFAHFCAGFSQLLRENLHKAAHRRRRRPLAANIAVMPTTTTDASSSFVIQAKDLRGAGAQSAQRRRRYPGRTGDFSSSAGLAPKPWLARLRHALREDLFVLHYQPIVSLQDGAVSHYEAL